MMNNDQKRFRQLNIFQSFDNCKKPKTTTVAPMEQKRDLLASAAERRIKSVQTGNSSVQKSQSSTLKSNLHDLLMASENSESQATASKTVASVAPKSTSSHCINPASQIDRRKEAESSQELFPESEEVFQSSEELFPDIEEYSSQNSTGSIKIGSLSCHEASPEIFSDTEDIQAEITEDNNIDSDEDDQSLPYINRKPQCSIPLPKLEPLENHTILFSPHIRPGIAPRPYPNTYKDYWDSDHVRMPCSPFNRFPVEDLNGEKQIKSRWELINQSLRRNIQSPTQLKEAIMTYNAQYKGRWNFNSLDAFFSTCLNEDELSHFFEDVLPAMIDVALNLPNICTQAPPLLRKGRDHYLTMSQKQIGCLLLNAFFCTFPRRNFTARHAKQNWNNEYFTYPDINFNRLFYGVKNRISQTSLEKLKCLINYFRRITSSEPSGTVTFHRQFLKDIPKWHESTHGISSVFCKARGLIESDGHGMLQVDFANKFVGGGVLGHGCVQEEIRFIICPELIVSRLFVECLGSTEVLVVTGVEQYSKYSGYSDTFKWKGNYEDETPRDAWGRRITQLVAMDATHFRNTSEQFQTHYVKRELTKAYCGFYENALPPNLSAVATGNWGCGAFNGNPGFKFLIQLIACSEARRDMLYFTFGNKALKKDLNNIYRLIHDKNLSVGDIWRILLSYSSTVKVVKNEPYPKIYDYLCSIFSNNETSTEELNACELLIQAVENEGSDTDIEDNNNESLLNDHG